MKPPGNDRLNILGDKTAEFYLNPKSFCENRVAKHKSTIFQQRFLNKPTVWLTDYTSVHCLLYEKCSNFDQGYDVMNILPQLFGSSCVLFQNGDVVIKLREILANSISQRVDKINRLLEFQVFPALDKMCQQDLECDLYQTIKEMMTKLFLQFFFDIDAEKEPELIATITKLSIEHWHGITSIPTSIKLVGKVFQKALNAKKRLIEIFKERLTRTDSEPPLVYTEMLSQIGEETAVDHVIVCISALLPKATASLLTSALIQMAMHRPLDRLLPTASQTTHVNSEDTSCDSPVNGGGDNKEGGGHNSEKEVFDALLKETYRLFPPFFGGRKVAKEEIDLGKYQIEQGQAIIYMSYFAHRDSKVFPYSEEYLPERWLSVKNKASSPSLFTFGGGKRECVGGHFTHHILTRILQHIAITSGYEVQLSEPETYYKEYKWLPVSRPKNPVRLKFLKSSQGSLQNGSMLMS
ncbi:probable cytochrome P450 513A3 isoform X2 [Symsagittifera roscoffensis]|uniref:probable cytochrome P450 513A3 isoform X2 n=1 Tax=Symsagittifera roscoffensis TaxID=84072 RepID=UPI00307B8755